MKKVSARDFCHFYGLPSHKKEKSVMVFITLCVVPSCGKKLSKSVMANHCYV